MPQATERDYLSPFRHRDFCIFWIGSFLSSMGTQFTTVAMAWQIYELTNSPLQIGLLGLARALPQMFLLLVGGLLADAMDRRKLMIFTQSGLFCVSTVLALLSFFGRASAQILYGATALLAIFTSLEQPSRQSMIPNLVPRENLTQALACKEPNAMCRSSPVRRSPGCCSPSPVPRLVTPSTPALGSPCFPPCVFCARRFPKAAAGEPCP